jgi:hypothetical protein
VSTPISQHTRRRVTLRLDSAIQTERRILERLDALPGRSGTDWLRALLTQGFLAEAQDHSADRPRSTQKTNPPAAAATQPEGAQNAQVVASQPDTPPALSRTSTVNKPFARLRELVG